MTNVFAVVGEHRDQPERLLLLGSDGHYYAFAGSDRDPVEVEPSDEWDIEEADLAAFLL
jgi:hypothetical protein